MKYPYPSYPTSVWRVNENMEKLYKVIPAGSQFWLEQVSVNNDLVCYRLNSTDTQIDSSVLGMYLYPVGIEGLPRPDPLPPWGNDNTNNGKSHDAALKIQSLGRANSGATRLEGAFVLPKGGTKPNESVILRIYYFAGAETNGRDWIVLDFIAPGGTYREDGTAHGDN